MVKNGTKNFHFGVLYLMTEEKGWVRLRRKTEVT